MANPVTVWLDPVERAKIRLYALDEFAGYGRGQTDLLAGVLSGLAPAELLDLVVSQDAETGIITVEGVAMVGPAPGTTLATRVYGTALIHEDGTVLGLENHPTAFEIGPGELPWKFPVRLIVQG